MHQLIITIFAIMLTSAMVWVGIKYVPVSHSERLTVAEKITEALPKLEVGYDVVTRANSGTPVAVTADADGGFATNYLPAIKFTPALPAKMTISYGKYAGAVARYADLNYFCLKGDASLMKRQPVWEGILRAKTTFSADQFFVSSACGVASNVPLGSTPPSTPYFITFFVAYVPPITP